MPVPEVGTLGLLDLQRVKVALRWTIGHLPPLILDIGTFSPSYMLLTSVRVHHIDFCQVVLELFYRFHPVLFNHVVHLIVAVTGRLHMADVRVACEGLARS